MTDGKETRRHNRYSLDELTKEADVTTRTVRYYIAEGLLPPPEGAGRHAWYSDTHLQRLLRIAELKADYLPLREIRRQLQQETQPPPSVAEDSAQSYLSRVDRRPSRSNIAMPAMPFIAAVDQREHPSGEATWKRLAVTDEAELLITDEALNRRREQIESALTWLRRILNDTSS